MSFFQKLWAFVCWIVTALAVPAVIMFGAWDGSFKSLLRCLLDTIALYIALVIMGIGTVAIIILWIFLILALIHGIFFPTSTWVPPYTG